MPSKSSPPVCFPPSASLILRLTTSTGFVPHQANIRIIDSMQKKFGLASEKVIRTVSDHANTSAASIPLALDAAVRDGRINAGHVVAFEAIGGGLSWGAALVRFGRP